MIIGVERGITVMATASTITPESVIRPGRQEGPWERRRPAGILRREVFSGSERPGRREGHWERRRPAGIFSESVSKRLIALPFVLLFLEVVVGTARPTSGLAAADLGDIDGDGRVSLGDAFLFRQWRVTGLEFYRPAAGSADFTGEFPCAREIEAAVGGFHWPELVLREAVRRASGEPLPAFLEPWPGPDPAALSPPRDAAVTLELLAVEHTTSDNIAELRVRMTSSVPVDFVALVIDSGELDLRPRYPPAWPTTTRRQTNPVSSTDYYLLTRGLLVYHTDMREKFGALPTIAPAVDHEFLLEAEIPRGTPPGEYALELLEATEVVTSFGTVVAPELLTPGTLTIRREVTEGHDLPFPPLEFTGPREIAGGCKVRLTGAEGLPGDEVTVKLQIFTERPVNYIETEIFFDPVALRVDSIRHVYVDPETDGPVELDMEAVPLNWLPRIDAPGGTIVYAYTPFNFRDDETLPAAVRNNTHVGFVPYWFDRSASLKYIHPLGEWVDLAEIRLTILPEARGRGDLSLTFPRTSERARLRDCVFLPYVTEEFVDDCGDDLTWWEHEPIEWIAGTVSILGGGDPFPPPRPPVEVDDANIRYSLGAPVTEEPVRQEFRGGPGDEVRIPVFLETDVPLWYLRMVFGFDAHEVELVGFELRFLDFDGVEFTRVLTPLGGCAVFNGSCLRDDCSSVGLFPYDGWIRDQREEVPTNRAFFDIQTVWRWGSHYRAVARWFWEPGVSYAIGDLLFRVRATAAPGRYPVAGETVQWRPGECSILRSAVFIESVSSGAPPFDKEDPPRAFLVSAREVTPAVIVVPGEGGDGALFIRGDANDDGQVNVSDPVHTLGALFAGNAELPCEDAADANDDGSVDVADAVLVLNHLFASGAEIPAPYPEAGVDPTEDALGCERIE